jgi:predicted dehydrogenase
MPFSIAIIGAGSIAAVHAEAAVRAGQNIAGFCDVREARAQNLAAKYPGAIATTSIDQLLGLPNVPAVVVAVPNYLHKSMAIAALDAGKDVLLEKPMAMNVAECDQIIAAMKRTGRAVQIGFVTRYSPTSMLAKRVVDAGRLGRIYHVKATLYRRRGIPGLGKWFTNKAESGGGVLIDLGVHQIDLVLHLTGWPNATTVSAVCRSTFGKPIDQYTFTEMWAGPPDVGGTFDVEDDAAALLRFDTGMRDPICDNSQLGALMTMQLNVTWAANLKEELCPSGIALFGDRGACWFEPTGRRFVLGTEQDGSLVDLSPELPPGDPWPLAWRRQHEVFAQTVQRQAPSPATADHGRSVQAIIEALYQSSQDCREVALPNR